MTFKLGHRTTRTVALGDDLRGWTRIRNKRMDELPYKRVGICCGKACRNQAGDTILYRVYDAVFRYRCRRCFYRERRTWP